MPSIFYYSFLQAGFSRGLSFDTTDFGMDDFNI